MSRPTQPVEVPELARDIATGRATARPGIPWPWRTRRSLHGIARGEPSAREEVRFRGLGRRKHRIEPPHFGVGIGNAGVMLAQDIDVPFPVLPDRPGRILIAHVGVLGIDHREVTAQGALVFDIQ